MGRITELLGDRVYLDTNVVIYCVEGYAEYEQDLMELLVAADGGELACVSSTLTLGEVLIVPKRMRDIRLEQAYRTFLKASPRLQLAPVTETVLMQSAEIRARTRMNLPDAIHMATVISERCTSFLTNDLDFESVPSCRVVQLAEVRFP